jgi:hypothetical protein
MKHRLIRLFILIATALVTASATTAELAELYLFKAAWHTQTSDADPELLPQVQDPFDLTATAYLSEEVFADPDALLFITGMTLRAGTGLHPMDYDPGAGAFRFYNGAVTAQALNLRYPPGIYRFTLHSLITGESRYNVPLYDDDYPPAPKVTNYTAAQQIDPARDFTLRWTDFTGGDVREVWVQIAVATNGQVVFAPPPLDGGATSVVVPAGTLEPETNYQALLTFRRYTHADFGTTLPSVYAGFEANNLLPLRTGTGGSPAPPRFTGWKRLANGDLELTVESPTARLLTLVAAEALDGAWTNLQTIASTGGATTFVVPRAALGGRQFFRVREG